jgi:hypothetical protein
VFGIIDPALPAHAKAFADRYGFDAVKMLQGVRIERVQVGEGREAGALNHAAMIRAVDNTVSEFARRVSTTPEAKKSYFEMRPDQGVLAGYPVILPADSIRHKDRRHPDMTDEDMDRLPRVLASLTSENLRLPKNDSPRFSGKGILATTMVDGQAYGLILESVRNGRIIVGTYFKDTEKGIQSWFDKSGDAKKAVTTLAPLPPGQASNNEDVLRDQPSSDGNITPDGQDGNTLFQPAPSVDSDAFRKWFGDSKEVEGTASACAPTA